MKIIDIGICVDNIDPKGIGRIRCLRYNDYVAEKERSITYDKWSDRDPFVALPFLPPNINFIPNINQAVKIITYNTNKETVNMEYIPGPFTTMYDFNNQQYTRQVENTTYGVSVTKTEDIRTSNGKYIYAESENIFAKETDYAIYGKYGSDILFTENGIQLRGGKLLPKENLTPDNKKIMIANPLSGKKTSKLYLKKFPKKMTIEEILTEKKIYESKTLNYIVEYEIDYLTSPTKLDFYVYKINKNSGVTYNTNFFNEDTPLIDGTTKLINLDDTTTTPTFDITLETESYDEAETEIRNILTTIHRKGLNGVNSLYDETEIHPFFFRPTPSFKQLNPSTELEATNKSNLLNEIYCGSIGPCSGLIWSSVDLTPPFNITKIKTNITKLQSDNTEQSFGAVISDKFYLLSTDTNETDKTIKFNELNQYDLDQIDYVEKIDPNTYALVRGENLINVLRAINDVIFSHAHNINSSISEQSDYSDGIKLSKLIDNLENDILNKSIRIN